MNADHASLCSSPEWARHIADIVVPETLSQPMSVANVLEIGPGYGAATVALARVAARLTVIEVEEQLAADLAPTLPRVTVVRGDGAALPFGTERFSSVLCFTMLHHVSSPRRQDDLLAEARRVLTPGGVFAGSDSMASPELAEFHGDDTYVPVDPATLPHRLANSGFIDVVVRITAPGERFAFSARTPTPQTPFRDRSST